MTEGIRFALAILCLAVTACSVATPRPTAIVVAPPSRHVLPNGVRVLIQEHRTSAVVALQLWVRAGGRDEGPSELGLAHYLEHMLFKGTVTRPGGFIDREVEGVGGRMNAGTSLDYTYYHMVLPARRAVPAIETLADISVNATLDEGALEREKKVVLEELRLSEDNPNRALIRQLYGLAFDGHPYGRPVIGTVDLIRSLAREQLLAFYRAHYVPEALTLVVVGDIDGKEILDAATRAFARLPRAGVRRLPAPIPAAPTPRRVEVARPGAQAHLAMAWLGPRLDHADTPAVDLLISILGQTRASRLTQSLRERLGLVNTITSAYSAMEAGGLVTVSARLDPANVQRAEAEIVAEIRRLRDHGVTDAERQRALTAAEARHEFEMETAEGRARTLGRAETIWRLESEFAYIDRLREVTTDQIRVAARRYLDPERYVWLAFLPTAAR
ncbi:MAG: insulinase family protein [Candidatus Rokubacteria bacterium]|nr:insulinase family protein [Candidatus Rokubacteria bacterium]